MLIDDLILPSFEFNLSIDVLIKPSSNLVVASEETLFKISYKKGEVIFLVISNGEKEKITDDFVVKLFPGFLHRKIPKSLHCTLEMRFLSYMFTNTS